MIIAFVFKLALLISLPLLSFPLAVSSATGEAFAASTPLAAQKYEWKYAVPDWTSPSHNLRWQFKADFQAPESEYGTGHRGVDFKSSIGEALRSPFTGTLIEGSRVGYRDVVTLKDSQGRLASLEPVCATVAIGTKLSTGQLFGKVCTPNSAYIWHCANCVHFSARINSQYLSPLVLTGDFRPSVTKVVTS